MADGVKDTVQSYGRRDARSFGLVLKVTGRWHQLRRQYGFWGAVKDGQEPTTAVDRNWHLLLVCDWYPAGSNVEPFSYHMFGTGELIK